MPTTLGHSATIAAAVFVLMALPSWIGCVYCLAKTPKEIGVAYGVPIKLARHRLAHALLFALVGVASSALALFLV